MKTNYTKYSKPQLKEKIKEFEMRIMKSYGSIEKKEKKENRKLLKKEIARIKTELNSRKDKK